MAGSSGTASLSDTRGDKNVVAQIAQLSWEKVKSAEKMAGAERAYARKRLKVGEEGGITKEEFRKKFGRGSFFRKALGSEFGGDKVARNRGRVESFFDKDVSAGRDATKSKRSRYRSQFDYGVEAKDPMVGGKTKAARTRQGGGGGSTGSNRAAVNEAIASALVGIEIQLTRLSEKFTNNISVPEGLAEIINAQSKVITEGFGGLNRALYSLLESIQRQTATMVRLDQEQKVLDQKNLDRQQALDEENLLEGQNGSAGNAAIKDLGRVSGGNRGGGILGKIFGASVLAKKIGRRGAARAGVRAAAAFGGKNAAKFMSKKTAGLAAKTGLKSGLKKIPLLGLGVGAFFAAQRALKGDILGAGLELTSGAASMIPGAGTAASLGVDGILAARDAGAIPFAKGGFVNKPVLGVVGEGKDPEAILPWNKRTFEMMQKARLDAIQKNKNKFADVQAKGLEEYYENRGGWEKFGEILISLLKGAGGIFDPNYQPGPPSPEPTNMLIPGDAPPEIKALMETISGGEGGANSVQGIGEVPGLSNMTIDQAIAKGESYIGKGSETGAIGAYQHIPSLLRDRAIKAGLDPSKDKFTLENQTKIQRTFMVGLYGQTEATMVRHLQEGKLESHIFPSLSRDAGWPSLPGGSQPNVHTAGAAERYKQGLKKYQEAAKNPPPTPTPLSNKPTGTDWLKGISDNFGIPLGGSFLFGPDNKYKAVRERDGWKLYDTTRPYLPGNQDISTINNANIGLKNMFIEKGRSLVQRDSNTDQANATSIKSQEVAMARASGRSFDIINVGSNTSSGAAVPKGESAGPGISRKDLSPAFTEVPVG